MTGHQRKSGSSPTEFYNDPDRQNSEQNEEGSQAQDVGADALAEIRGDLTDPPDKENPFDVVPRDVPDLVGVEKSMLRSGRIDMDAFAGEPDMDDENS